MDWIITTIDQSHTPDEQQPKAKTIYPDLYKGYGVGLNLKGMPKFKSNSGSQILGTFVEVSFVPNIQHPKLFLWWRTAPNRILNTKTYIIQRQYAILQAVFHLTVRDYVYKHKIWDTIETMEVANPFYPLYWQYLATVCAPYIIDVSKSIISVALSWLNLWKDYNLQHRHSIFIRFEITCQVKKIRSEYNGDRTDWIDINPQLYYIWISLWRVKQALSKDITIGKNQFSTATKWPNFTQLLFEAFQKSKIISSEEIVGGANASDIGKEESVIRYFWTTKTIGVTFFLYDPTEEYRNVPAERPAEEWLTLRNLDQNNSSNSYIWELWTPEYKTILNPYFFKEFYQPFDRLLDARIETVYALIRSEMEMNNDIVLPPDPFDFNFEYVVTLYLHVRERITITENGIVSDLVENFMENAIEEQDLVVPIANYSKKFLAWLNSSKQRFEWEFSAYKEKFFSIVLESVLTGNGTALCEFLETLYDEMLGNNPSKKQYKRQIVIYDYMHNFNLKKAPKTDFHGHFVPVYTMWNFYRLSWIYFHGTLPLPSDQYPTPINYGYIHHVPLFFHNIQHEIEHGACFEIKAYIEKIQQQDTYF